MKTVYVLLEWCEDPENLGDIDDVNIVGAFSSEGAAKDVRDKIHEECEDGGLAPAVLRIYPVVVE